ncbi:uncharacterized protein V1518DRAFT_437732 [Limtongia smithiae]|uniref:uncharacterized protein n=1 Tax=Limtongia smithiae TaxID=1125753 RepID=UPI0034CF57C1
MTSNPYSSRADDRDLLSAFGLIYVLPTHLSLDAYRDLTDALAKHGATITQDANSADLVLAELNSGSRAMIELRRRAIAALMFQLRKRIDQSSVSDEQSSQVMENSTLSTPQAKSPRGRKRKEETPSSDSLEDAPKAPKSPTTSRARATATKNSDLRPLDAIYFEKYSCMRPHPIISVNEDLSDVLKKVRHLRELEGNEVSVRAYSSAIAAIRSYPYKITTADEIQRLPGCGAKVHKLVAEYLNTGTIASELHKYDSREVQAIQEMYDVWGVGGRVASDFYHTKGWRSVSDLKEKGWDTLTSHQKAGVTYYDDFKTPLQHIEVTRIRDVIDAHAVRIASDAISTVCGSYRRGLATHGDVDIVISSPTACNTATGHHSFLLSLLKSLKQDNHVTEVLTVSHGSKERKLRGSNMQIDFALVIWKNKTSDPEAKVNYSRVDIICCQWNNIGPAIVGWTGGTTFERDLRLRCKDLGLKFTNGGIVDRKTNKLIDTSAPTLELAERRVFELAQVPYIEPELRNTG